MKICKKEVRRKPDKGLILKPQFRKISNKSTKK